MTRKLALIIGNSEYQDTQLARLVTPAGDAGDLAGVLRAAEIGGFDEVVALINASAPVVRRAIARLFADKKPDDLLLLYFSGHGIRDDRGLLYLAVQDTEHDLLNATAIPAAFVTEEMDRSRSRRQVLILDCCHSGAFAHGAKGAPGISVGTAAAFEGAGYGRVVLTATDSTQYAWEGDQLIGSAENSVFTHYLVAGLQTGQADLDGDGTITLDELYDFVYEQVVTRTPKQTPRKFTYNQQGEVVIARNAQPAGKPADLPPELRQALESPFASVREGGLRELERLVQASHRGLMLAAVEALERLTHDDSRRMSAAAEAILAAHAQAQSLQADQQRLAAEAAERDRQARQAAERLAAQRAEASRQAAEKAAAELAARESAERVIHAREADERRVQQERRARQQQESEQAAQAKAQADQKAAAEQLAERERLARQQQEAEQAAKARAQADQKAAAEQLAEHERRARQQREAEQAAKAKAQADQKAAAARAAREQAERLAVQKPNPADAPRPPVAGSQPRNSPRPAALNLVLAVLLPTALVALGYAVGWRLALEISNTIVGDGKYPVLKTVADAVYRVLGELIGGATLGLVLYFIRRSVYWLAVPIIWGSIAAAAWSFAMVAGPQIGDPALWVALTVAGLADGILLAIILRASGSRVTGLHWLALPVGWAFALDVSALVDFLPGWIANAFILGLITGALGGAVTFWALAQRAEAKPD